MSDLPYAFGEPPLTARLRAGPEDFQVEEILGYDADGAGEHALLWVEKRGANTDWVARELAKFAGVAQVAVGYAGLKDRHAVTRQTFSVQLAGKPDPDCYLLAARLLGADPRRSVAIEDSEYGVAAAVAAGMATIAVPLHVPLPESPAYTTWPDLAGRTPADLADVLGAHA